MYKLTTTIYSPGISHDVERENKTNHHHHHVCTKKNFGPIFPFNNSNNNKKERIKCDERK